MMTPMHSPPVAERHAMAARARAGLALLLGLATGLPATAQAARPAPLLAPRQDVSLVYQFTQGSHPPMVLTVQAEGGGRHLRISGEDLPVTIVIDRDAELARLLLPIAQAYAEVPVGDHDPERGFLAHAHFTRLGPGRQAGLACTNWRAVSGADRAEACITDGGIILQGRLTSANGTATIVTALRVTPGMLDRALFRVPAGYTNTGNLPIPPLAPGQ